MNTRLNTRQYAPHIYRWETKYCSIVINTRQLDHLFTVNTTIMLDPETRATIETEIYHQYFGLAYEVDYDYKNIIIINWKITGKEDHVTVIHGENCSNNSSILMQVLFITNTIDNYLPAHNNPIRPINDTA